MPPFLKFADAAAVDESTTCTVKEKLPTAVASPDKTPEELKLKPAGKAPAVTDHVYGGTPPEACSWVE